jgi:PKD repeat protein
MIVIVLGTPACESGGEPFKPPPDELSADVDWEMVPHLSDKKIVVDAPPPAPISCPPAPAGNYADGPFACTDGAGNAGCRYALPLNSPLTFESTPCLTGCTPGTAASCQTTCGTAGTETCGPTGAWGACKAYEICDGLDNDCDEKIDNDGVCQSPFSDWDPQHDRGWDTWLDGCRSTSKRSRIVAYTWRVATPDDSELDSWVSTGCRAQYTFPKEGDYKVTLTVVNAYGETESKDHTVTIKNYVVASIGDSVASGEGNPDEPVSDTQGGATWKSRRCHRSMQSGHARTALALEAADPHTSVTFVSLACSGAGVMQGLINPYAGEERLADDKPDLLPPQTSELHRIMSQARNIDILLLQVGANDMGFGDVAEDCAYPAYFVEDRDVLSCANDDNTKRIADAISDLEHTRYPRLKATMAASLPLDGTRVYIHEYHDLTHDDDGSICGEIVFPGAITDAFVKPVPDPSAPFLSAEGVANAKSAVVRTLLEGQKLTDGQISAKEAAWAHDNVIVPLNQAVRRAAEANGWTFVPGVAEAFGPHGYCANDHWVVRYDESKRRQVNHDGSLHPNAAGHAQMQKLLYAKIAADFGITGPPQDGGSDVGDGGDAADAGVADAGGDS